MDARTWGLDKRLILLRVCILPVIQIMRFRLKWPYVRNRFTRTQFLCRNEDGKRKGNAIKNPTHRLKPPSAVPGVVVYRTYSLIRPTAYGIDVFLTHNKNMC